MSVDIYDVITCATFCDDLLKGLGVARDRISRFPIDLRRRPYSTRTTVRVCDTDLIEFNPRRLKGLKELSSHATDLFVYAKSTSSLLRTGDPRC